MVKNLISQKMVSMDIEVTVNEILFFKKEIIDKKEERNR